MYFKSVGWSGCLLQYGWSVSKGLAIRHSTNGRFIDHIKPINTITISLIILLKTQETCFLNTSLLMKYCSLNKKIIKNIRNLITMTVQKQNIFMKKYQIFKSIMIIKYLIKLLKYYMSQTKFLENMKNT